MASEKLIAMLNEQIRMEFSAFYKYLGMAAWCERADLPGIASWLEQQAEEEHVHAMKIYHWMNDWDYPVELKSIDAASVSYGSIVEVFEGALKNEQDVSGHIHLVCQQAEEEHALAVRTAFDWFITEQVEEESTARENLANVRRVAKDPAGLYYLDGQLGGRTAGGNAGEG